MAYLPVWGHGEPLEREAGDAFVVNIHWGKRLKPAFQNLSGRRLRAGFPQRENLGRGLEEASAEGGRKYPANGYVFFVILFAGILSCAHGLSRDAKSLVDYDGSALEVQQAPDQVMGRVVLWGGRIIETRVLEDRTDVIVLQQPLEFDDSPRPSDEYYGRFIIRSPRLLDPAVFKQDLLVSVVGTLKNVEVSNVGEREYIYPVIEPEEVKVWKPKQEMMPTFHFGFGFGTQF